MKIGISLLVTRRHHTGVENYACNLVKHLHDLDSDDEFVIIADTRMLPWVRNLSPKMSIVDVHLPSQRLLWLWEHLFFLMDPRAKNLDLVHFPIGGGVLGFSRNFVLTVHDLKHYANRELVLLRRHLLWRVWCKHNIKRAERIITVSEFVKNEILHEFPVQESDVEVIPNGVDERFVPAVPSSDIRTKLGLPERYLLFVGQTSTNKNLRRAIEAVSLVIKEQRTSHCFVIAGSPGENDAVLRSYVKDHNLENMVRFIGYVSDSDLPQLYSNADLFLFPSLMEGFGIPPIEAMRCGIPTVVAHATCMPEVLGDAPIWVDPLSVASIAQGIRVGLFDQDIRARAVERGLMRANHFSWASMARQTLGAYREAAAQHESLGSVR